MQHDIFYFNWAINILLTETPVIEIKPQIINQTAITQLHFKFILVIF